MDKIFEERNYDSGGTRAELTGYVLGKSEDEIRDRLNCHTGYTIFKEISFEEYNSRKEKDLNRIKKLYAI